MKRDQISLERTKFNFRVLTTNCRRLRLPHSKVSGKESLLALNFFISPFVPFCSFAPLDRDNWEAFGRRQLVN